MYGDRFASRSPLLTLRVDTKLILSSAFNGCAEVDVLASSASVFHSRSRVRFRNTGVMISAYDGSAEPE